MTRHKIEEKVLGSVRPFSATEESCRYFRRLSAYTMRSICAWSASSLLALTLLVAPLSADNRSPTKTITVGTTPSEIVVNPSAHLAYVVNQGSDSVSVIDTQLLKVDATLTAGSSPIGIAVNPSAGKVYIGNSASGTITVISAKAVQATWTVGGTPSALVVDPVLNQLYVMDTSGNQVDILDGSKGSILTTISTTLPPTALTINIATHAVFVACSGSSGSVIVIDGNHNSVITTVSVVVGTTSISVDPATNLVIVESPSAATHTLINAGAGYTTQTETFSSDEPFASAYGAGFFFTTFFNDTVIAFTAGDDGLFRSFNAFDTGELNSTGLAINPSTFQMVAIYPGGSAVLIDLNGMGNPFYRGSYHDLTAGNGVAGAAFDPLGNRVFITNSTDGTVSVFDIIPNELIDAYQSGCSVENCNPSYNFIDANPATGTIYNLHFDNLYAVNEAAVAAGYTGLQQNTTGVTTIPLANFTPGALAVNVAANKIYAGDSINALYSVDGATTVATLVSGLPNNTDIQALAMDYATNQLIAYDSTKGNVFVLDGSTAAVLQTIPTEISDIGILQVDSSRNLVYLGVQGFIYVINPATGSVVTTITVPGAVLGAAINPAKNRLYAVDNDRQLTVVNTSTNTIVAHSVLPYTPESIAVNPVSGNYYVGLNDPSSGTPHVFEYNGANNRRLQDFSGSTFPEITGAVSLLANPLIGTVYVGTGNAHSTSVLAAIDERSGTVSGVTPQFDEASEVLALDLGTGILGSGGAAYTNLVFPTTMISGSAVPITVTGSGVADGKTIVTAPLFRTRNTKPSFTITATENFGISSTALVPTHAFYQVDGWAGTWKGAALKLNGGTHSSSATIKISTALTTGLHILYVYASDADVATIQAGLPSGNSVGNSPVISSVGTIVFTVEE